MKTKSLMQQSIYLISGRTIAHILTILHPMILVRVFSTSDYGQYRQLMLIYTTLLPLGTMGVTQGIYYFFPRVPEKRETLILQTFIFVFALGALSLGGLIFFRVRISDAFNTMAMVNHIPFLGIYCFCMITSSFIEPCLIADNKSDYASFFVIGSQILHTTSVIITAAITRDIQFLMWALTGFGVLRVFLIGWYAQKRYRFSLIKIDWQFWRTMLRFSLPAGFSNVAWLVQTKLHNYFVSFLFSPSTFATYSIGAFNLPFISIITSSVGNVMAPNLSRHHKEGNMKEIIRLWHASIRKMNLLLFPIFVFFFLMGDAFILALFTSKYEKSIIFFRICLIGILFSGINTGTVLWAFAETKYLMKIAFIRIPVVLIILYVFTLLWGALGAIIADILVMVFFRFFTLVKVSKVLEIKYIELIEWKNNGLILMTAVISATPLCLLKHFTTLTPFLMLTVSAALFSISYLSLGISGGIINKKDISRITALIPGLKEICQP